jgi:hypothetical protein
MGWTACQDGRCHERHLKEACPWARLPKIWRESRRSDSIWRRLFSVRGVGAQGELAITRKLLAAGGSDRCVGSRDCNDRRQAHRNGQRRQGGSPLDDDTGRRPVIAVPSSRRLARSRPLRAGASSPPFSASRHAVVERRQRAPRAHHENANRYLRKLLVVGATTVLHHAIGHNDSLRRWGSQPLLK